ncbi:MAG: XRE family transcriptional regulator [Asticcacaulis sp.]|nr:XRE family transcriptional regulator [Asticcacaulis sp.]
MINPKDLPHLRTQAERLKWARERSHSSMRSAANAYGWNENTYKSHEQGIRRNDGLVVEDAKKYARAFKVPVDWLLLGTTKMAALPSVPIIGKAAAGINGFAVDDYEPNTHPALDLYQFEDAVAVQVDGDSMQPRFNHGELLMFGRATQDPIQHVGHEVLTEVSDGRLLIKLLYHNKYTGNWDLISHNSRYEPITDKQLLWTRPFIGLLVA